jgi:hypothetical protein
MRRALECLPVVLLVSACSGSTGSPIAPIGGGVATATPAPSATPVVTATPSAVPTATPTPKPAATPTPKPTATPTSAPFAQKLYIANNESSSGLIVYALPLTSASTALVTLPTTANFSVGVDGSGDVMAGDDLGNISYFANPPLTIRSVPAFSFTNGTATSLGQLAVMPGGTFFATTDSNVVNEFQLPLSSGSVPAKAIANAVLTSTIGDAVDASGNLYVGNVDSHLTGKIAVFAPPYTGAPVVSIPKAFSDYFNIALSSTQLFAINRADGLSGSIDVYTLPITSSSTPAFKIAGGVAQPESVAVDAAGNLYLANNGSSTVVMYRPPFSASSVPVVAISFDDGFDANGMTVGR